MFQYFVEIPIPFCCKSVLNVWLCFLILVEFLHSLVSFSSGFWNFCFSILMHFFSFHLLGLDLIRSMGFLNTSFYQRKEEPAPKRPSAKHVQTLSNVHDKVIWGNSHQEGKVRTNIWKGVWFWIEFWPHIQTHQKTKLISTVGPILGSSSSLMRMFYKNSLSRKTHYKKWLPLFVIGKNFKILQLLTCSYRGLRRYSFYTCEDPGIRSTLFKFVL